MTPNTNVGVPLSFEGAEMMTFFAPAARCSDAFSVDVKMPVHSRTISALSSFQGSCVGSFSLVTLIVLPLTTRLFSVAETSPLKRPCVESYFRRCAISLAEMRSLMPTNSIFLKLASVATRMASLPMRPKPLIPIRSVIHTSECG